MPLGIFLLEEFMFIHFKCKDFMLVVNKTPFRLSTNVFLY